MTAWRTESARLFLKMTVSAETEIKGEYDYGFNE